jgi:phosphatidylserine/phosphatidylglycerophosphate/cardiolipin synthase-like enzyme
LHTKSLTLDGEVTLIGSANMDRRSFELNYENNILFYDPSLTSEMRRRQDAYLFYPPAVKSRSLGELHDAILDTALFQAKIQVEVALPFLPLL